MTRDHLNSSLRAYLTYIPILIDPKMVFNSQDVRGPIKSKIVAS
jgi:hypothetical protein